jgi:hypothetical protein
MRLKSKWNRRSFLGSVGAITGAILSGSIFSGSTLAPRKLFGRNRAAARATVPVSGFGKTGNPFEELGSIVIGSGEGRQGLAMNSFMLQPGEDKIVSEQLSGLLREHAA